MAVRSPDRQRGGTVPVSSSKIQAVARFGVIGRGSRESNFTVQCEPVCLSPWTRERLPPPKCFGVVGPKRATRLDQLGLSARSPFPGHSQAAFWSLAPGQAPPETTPALSELAHFNAFQPQPQDQLSRGGLQMSLVASGRYYIRGGTGSEQLYDLRRDPSELVNLADAAEGRRALGDFRRMLLNLLAANPGSTEVEIAYLKPYRRWLESLVPATSPPVEPTAALGPR
jgi:hypothetical protein